ncbi:colicin V production protein [mine drainage metagenome]|uniref:Colicin V production protein n=1 Tax=mine drainage metagenome TaxID=410659 RepID=A0A1J5RK37_9ZZZZ
MTGFDYAVLSIIALSSLLGLWRGVVSELLGLAAWVAAFFAARAWGLVAAASLARWISEPAWRAAAGFTAVFLVTLLIFAAARFVLSRLLRAVGLGFADRLLGALFGVMRGVLVVLAAVLVCGMTALPRQHWWREASLAPPLETAVLALKPWLPKAVAQRIRYG